MTMTDDDDRHPDDLTDEQLDLVLAASSRELLDQIETTADPSALRAIMAEDSQDVPAPPHQRIGESWPADRPRIVVIGDLMTDTIARPMLRPSLGSDTPATITVHGGGSGANVAAWLAVDGAEVAFIGRRGMDIVGRNRDMELMSYGVDARLVMDPERPTGTCVVMVTHKGERTMLADPGANAALSVDDLPRDLFGPGAHLHISGYTLLSNRARNAALAALDYARQAGMSSSVDAASDASLERVGAKPFLDLSGNALLLFVSATQAKILTGREEPEQAAEVLTALYPQVVINMDPNGAQYHTKGRPPVHVLAPRVERVIDGTGASDAFIAGFLSPWVDKKPPAEALASGLRLADQAMNLIGARPVL
jgi:sugar/nucleoside kinase (ribokinase family)